MFFHTHLLTLWQCMLTLVNIHSVQLRKLFRIKLSPINPLNTKLNPICHSLALLGAHHILHISRVRVNVQSNAGHLTPVFCILHQGFHYSTSFWTATSQDTVYFYDKLFSCYCPGDTDRTDNQSTGPTIMLKQSKPVQQIYQYYLLKQKN